LFFVLFGVCWGRVGGGNVVGGVGGWGGGGGGRDNILPHFPLTF